MVEVADPKAAVELVKECRNKQGARWWPYLCSPEMRLEHRTKGWKGAPRQNRKVEPDILPVMMALSLHLIRTIDPWCD